jgi:single stranded DNA-binding protein
VDYCKITVTGRLTQDGEYKEIGENKTPMLRCSMAYSYDKDDHTNYLNFTMWGKYATVMSQYMKKGQAILVEGPLKQERWEEGDNKRHTYKIASADKIILLGGAKKDDAPKQSEPVNVEEQFSVEEVPF